MLAKNVKNDVEVQAMINSNLRLLHSYIVSMLGLSNHVES